ncbi:MAG: hypothetical protein ACR2F5_03755 [Candidatus Limnocylindria bacterium]
MPRAGTLPGMNARTPADRTAITPYAPRAAGGINALWALLLLEIAFAMAVTIFLSIAAGDQRNSIGGEAGVAAENSTRFAAGGAFLFAIAAYFAFRGVRRRRTWAWTLSAVLQLILAISGAIAMLATGEAGPTVGFLVAFALAAITMIVLSTSGVRRAMGQA